MSSRIRQRIPTFTWLIEQAKALLQTDPETYKNLRQGGTTRLLKGWWVSMKLQDFGGRNEFRIQATEDGPVCCTLWSARVGQDFYTVFEVAPETTTIPAWLQDLLPSSLPPVAESSPRKPVRGIDLFGVSDDACGWVRMAPETYEQAGGALIAVRDSDESPVTSAKLQSAVRAFHRQNPTDILHGFLPGSCPTSSDWYRSMEPPEVDHSQMIHEGSMDGSACEASAPLWNGQQMQSLAARTYSEALRFVTACPSVGIALYPMTPKPRESPGCLFDHGPMHLNRFGAGGDGEARESVVVGRTIDKELILYWLPELVVFWTRPARKRSPKYDHIDLSFVRYCRLVIPPVGCQSLLRGPGDWSPQSNYLRGGPNSERFMWREVLEGRRVQERCCHGLVAFDRRTVGAKMHDYTHRTPFRHTTTGSAVNQSHSIHDWDADQSVVVVHECGRDRTLSPYVSDPTNVFKDIEHREFTPTSPDSWAQP